MSGTQRTAALSSVKLALLAQQVRGQIDGADILIFEEHLLPGGAAILRAVDAAIGIRGVSVAEGGDEQVFARGVERQVIDAS